MKNYYSKIIKIPYNIVAYFLENNVLVFCNALSQKSLKLKTNVIILKNMNSLILLSKFNNVKVFKKSNLYKTYESIVNITCKSIQQYFKKKLVLIGVGYKISLIAKKTEIYLDFKLGYSHSIFFKVPKNIKVSIPKPNKIYILGYNFLNVSQISSFIKLLRKPDSYKGKGFRYDNEILKLKEGKKI